MSLLISHCKSIIFVIVSAIEDVLLLGECGIPVITDVHFVASSFKDCSCSNFDCIRISKYLAWDKYSLNGLKQTASQVFMKNDFGYQVVNSTLEDGLSANFWATEKGWLQSAVLPGFAAQYLGQLLPLAIPGFKYKINHVDVISSGQSFSDQLVSLQTAQNRTIIGN